MNYGPYEFIMQTDCNLVLYDRGKPAWASNTGGLAKNCYVVMQSDGNLVIYTNTNNKAVWASNTGRDKANYVLVLQKDRNVVIYGPAIWATNTHVGPSSANNIVITSKASTKVASLPANVTYESNPAGNAIVGVGHN
ncbi:hypothetical protein J5N97_006189 [Dioscorea zingiberensis]|uniref:Bulb-type lectin domain-containing protein n=1 Tax=Dioscorea zingiberensis TaxID=325984 RepID=A0A9D5DBG6_9LILI|nr:hypothetical protein J5N97_006189 [Dioscorea zingiberensis]